MMRRRKAKVLVRIGTVIATSVMIAGLGATAANASVERPVSFGCPNGNPLGGLYPDPNNSGQFYSCSNGTAYPAECPLGLAFNPLTIACSLPQNAVSDLIDKIVGTLAQI
jgi:hypothetical protein